MPMLTTLRMRLPVWPSQRPLRTASAKAIMRSSTRVHLGDDVDAVDDERRRPRACAARRAAPSASRCVLMTSPRNIAAVRSRRPHASASSTRQPHRLVGDAVLRVVEVQAGGLEHEPLAAPGVGGEQLAQVHARRSRRGARRAPARPARSRRPCAPLIARVGAPASCAVLSRDAAEQARPTTSRTTSAPSFCSCVGERVDVDAEAARTRRSPLRRRRRRPASARRRLPWSAKASSVLSGIVSTVSGAASAST